MPLNIIIAILALLITLILYSIGTWGAFRSKGKKLSSWIIILAGFVFDSVATTMMIIQAGSLQNDLHTVLALLAMAGMLLAAALGLWTMQTNKEKITLLVARWVPVPWLIWLIVFVYGMIERGSARLVH